jgi:hypothetical protein
MGRLVVAALSWLAVVSLAVPASAASVLYTGSFDITLSPAIPGGTSKLVGAFSFYFDESTVDPAGTFLIDVALESLSMTTIGATTFTPANAAINLYYEGGVFNNAALGGLPNPRSAEAGTDDFYATFAGPTLAGAQFVTSAARTAADPGTVGFSISPSSGAITPVPEPSSAAMAGLAASVLLGWSLRRRDSSTTT